MTDEELIRNFAILRGYQRNRDKARPYSQQRKELEADCRWLENKVDAAIKERTQRMQKERNGQQFGFDFTEV